MFGSMQNGVNAYAKVGIETGVTSASPHKLIVMLFDGAQISLVNALQHMKAGNIAAKGQAISKAISIIDSGLRASLDKAVGGEVAANLDRLYEYMSNRLLIANLNNEPHIIEEVQGLLQDIKSAWVAIDSQSAATAAPAPLAEPAAAKKPSMYDALVPQTSRLVKA